MKKKSLAILFIALSILVIGLFFGMENHSVPTYVEQFSSLCIEDADSIRYGKDRTNSLKADLSFNGFQLFYNRKDNNFFYSLQEGNSFAYDPLVMWQSSNIKVAFEGNGINDETIKNNETNTIILYNDKQYSEYKLTCTTLSIINIDMFEDDFGSNYSDCTFTIFDNRSGDDGKCEQYEGKVRIRGGSTGDLPKPGLRIKLNSVLKGDNNKDEKKYDLFGLEPDNEYVIYTSNVEKDFVRNVFSTNLWYDTCADDNAYGLKLGMSYKYVELFKNGEYWGLCAIGNPISKKRGYVDLDPKSDKYPLENIYKCNFVGYEELLDIEKHNTHNSFFSKTNEDINGSREPLYEYLKTIIYSKDYDELINSADMDNAIDIFLFYNLVQGWDNSWLEEGKVKLRNTYLISKICDHGTQILFVPWDLDHTWGFESGDDPNNSMNYTINYDVLVNPVDKLILYGHETIKDDVLNKYRQLRENQWSDEAIMNMLDEYEKDVCFSGAFIRDGLRWPNNVHDEENDLELFKEYVMNRIHYFDEYIETKMTSE